MVWGLGVGMSASLVARPNGVKRAWRLGASSMIVVVILIAIVSVRTPSVAHHREKAGQGHDCRGDQEDDQPELARWIAPSLARQPTEDYTDADEPGVPHAPRLCPPLHLRQRIECCSVYHGLDVDGVDEAGLAWRA